MTDVQVDPDPDPISAAEADAEVAEALLALGAATLGESGAAAMSSDIAAMWAGARLAGRALPVQCSPADNLALHVALTHVPPAGVLVASTGAVGHRGYWGEVLTTAAEQRGVGGLVIGGCVRDVAALAAHRFPVFATGIALPGATKERRGSVGRPVVVGGVVARTGDWVVGDADGVVVVGAGDLVRVLAAARARAAKEERYFAQLRAGATTVELLGLDASLVERA